MRISSKGRYALRLMLDLALNNTGEYVTIKNSAARQGISEKYMEQIVPTLSRAGYVQSIRGAQGGYRLASAPEEYTIGMILRLTEGSLAASPGVERDFTSGDAAAVTVIQDVCEELNQAISQVVDRITLQDMVDQYLALQKSGE